MKFWYNPNFWAVTFLIIFAIPALKSLAIANFYTSHDGETHTARIAQYYQAIVDGQIPPRWAKTLNDGLGSPIFTYIYPLPYIFGSLVHALGFSFTDSFEILMALSFIFSGIFCYLWLNEVWQSKKAAFLGALFYQWLPYRFLLIYVRASISEALAYTFLPLVLYLLTKLSKESSSRLSAVTAISFSLLLLSQNLVALISLPLIVVYVIFYAVWRKSQKFLILATFSLLLGFLISAFSYFPALLERHLIHFDEAFKLVYKSHFITLGQLIHSPWGYGFDLPGTVNDEMSFQIGLAHLLVLALAVLIIIALFLKRFNLTRAPVNFLIQKVAAFQINLTLLFLAVFIFSIILILQASPTLAIWQIIRPLIIIDLPWRLLGISALAAAFLASFVVRSLKPGLFFILLITAVLVANRNHLRINKTAVFDDNFFLNYRGTATQLNEFIPKTRHSTITPTGFDKTIEVIEGDVQVTELIKMSNQLSFKTQAQTPSRLQVNLFYFPNWQVFMDDKQLRLGAEFLIGDELPLLNNQRDNSGLFIIKPPEGLHHFSFVFRQSTLEKFSNLISLVASSVALILIIKKGKNLAPIKK